MTFQLSSHNKSRFWVSSLRQLVAAINRSTCRRHAYSSSSSQNLSEHSRQVVCMCCVYVYDRASCLTVVFVESLLGRVRIKTSSTEHKKCGTHNKFVQQIERNRAKTGVALQHKMTATRMHSTSLLNEVTLKCTRHAQTSLKISYTSVKKRVNMLTSLPVALTGSRRRSWVRTCELER